MASDTYASGMEADGGLRRERAATVLARSAGRLLEAEQERLFLWLPVLFGAGVWAYFALAVEPPAWLAGLAAIGAFGLNWWAPRGLGFRTAGIAALAFAAGFLAAKLRTEYMRAPVLARQITRAEVTGWLELVEPRATRGQRLTILVTGASGFGAEPRPWRVRVRTLAADPELKPGQRVRVRATLGPPGTPSFPGDFDFARTAWFSALGGVGYTREAAEVLEGDASPPAQLVARAAIEVVRQAITARIVAALPGERGAIAAALITGERGAITDATNQAYRDSGLFHILSISGLHMVIMAGAIFVLIRVVLAAIPAIALRYPIKKWAAAGAMAGALGYLLISGSSFATVRSYIMISIMFLAVLLDRPAATLRNVALAALGILVVWPESLLDAGFQMSFAAVVGLVSVFEMLRERAGAGDGEHGRLAAWGVAGQAAAFVGGIVLTTLIASFTVAPFSVYHFHNSQQFAILANVIAIPICNVVVMPAALATLIALPVGLEYWPLQLMGLGIDAMTGCAQAVAGLPGAVAKIPAIPTVAFACMVLGGLWLALWSGRVRYLGLLAVLAGLALAPGIERPDVLVSRDGTMVAVRAADGRLSALSAKGSSFDLGRWLEADGDARAARVAAAASAFKCDDQGCRAGVRGVAVAVSKSPATLADDCARTRVLVLRGMRPRGCRGPEIVLDERRLRRLGAHAIFVEREPGGADGSNGAALRVATVEEMRGDRPWASAGRDRAAGGVAEPRENITGAAGANPRFDAPRPDDEEAPGPRRAGERE